jgi:DNA mismatch repair ATPase MutL
MEEPLFLPSDDPPLLQAPPHKGVTVVAKEILEEPTPSAPRSRSISPRTTASDEEEKRRGRENSKRLPLKRKASGSPLRSPSFEPAETVNPPPVAPPPKESTASIAPWSYSEPVQMVLSTAGASWALQKGPGGSSKGSMKGAISKPPVGSGSSLKGMRNILNQFKRGDARGLKEVGSGDEENDEEMVADEEVDKLETPAKDDDRTMDVNQARQISWIPVPTPSPTPAMPATRPVEGVDTNQQIQVQNGLEESLDQPNSGMIVPEMDLSTRRTTDECSPIKDPSEREVVEIVPDDEVVRSFVVSTTTVRFDLASVGASWRAAVSSLSTSAISAPDHPTSSLHAVQPSEITSNAGEAEATLSRVVSKDDFGQMDVLGQFNQAFVITRLCKPTEGHDDLFIVDQHAADEKYNFERLQIETRIETQKLIKWVSNLLFPLSPAFLPFRWPACLLACGC